MRKLKHFLGIFLCAALCVSAFTLSAQAVTTNYAKSISVTKKATITIPYDKKTAAKSYAVTVKVSGSASKAFTAKSSKTSVATVAVSGSKIKVTAKKAGTAKIVVTAKAKDANGKALKAALTLTVKKSSTLWRLVKGAKYYRKNYETGKWELDHKVILKYKNAYPAEIDTIQDFGDGDEIFKKLFNYTFENGVPVKCVCTEDGTPGTTTMEYNKGRLYEVHYKSDNSSADTYYQYANGNDYFTSLVKEFHQAGSEYNKAETMEETDSVQVTLKDGIIAKSVNSGFYANWQEGEDKQWLRFNGTYTCTYDSDGIVKLMEVDYRKFVIDHAVFAKFATAKKNGFITKAVTKNPDGSDYEKVVFEYTDTTISPARFSNMMNYFISGAGTNYYNNNWF